MTSPELDWVVTEEPWKDETVLFSPELISRMRELRARAAVLHAHNYGPGGDWNGRPDFYCCF